MKTKVISSILGVLGFLGVIACGKSEGQPSSVKHVQGNVAEEHRGSEEWSLAYFIEPSSLNAKVGDEVGLAITSGKRCFTGARRFLEASRVIPYGWSICSLRFAPVIEVGQRKDYLIMVIHPSLDVLSRLQRMRRAVVVLARYVGIDGMTPIFEILEMREV